MRIGITGHQEREGMDWCWVEKSLEDEIMRLTGLEAALTSLAKGADQLFAEVAMRCGCRSIAVIPFASYPSYFEGAALARYTSLLAQSEQVELRLEGAPEIAFLRAGKYIVDHVDLLFAVWDGQPAEGIGGTSDIVEYAKQKARPIIHIDPISRTTRYLTAA